MKQSMTTADQILAARDQLNRTLTFFPRVDAKASLVLAIDTSMLALLGTRAFPYTQLRWELAPIGVTLVLLGTSLWNLYQQAFPSLEGGHQSMLYFREIARRTEANYIDAWKQMTDEAYLRDCLGQVWRNSEILAKKFDHLKWAFASLALAIIPWLASLLLLSWKLASLPHR